MVISLQPLRRIRRRRRAARETTPAPAPFVVGVGRSGTTMLRLMLDAHPEMAVPPETHFLPDVIRACDRGASPERVVEILQRSRRWGDMGIGDSEIRCRFASLERWDATQACRAIYQAYAEPKGKSRWGDKTPKYSLVMAEIEDALPEARFIHLIRDARAVALSRVNMVEGRGEKAPSPAGVAGRWAKRIRQARRQGERLGGYLEVRYEDLVIETEPTLRRICEFIELEFDPAMLDYHEHASERLSEIARDLPDAEGKRKGVVAGEHRLKVHALAKEPPDKGRITSWKTRMSAADQRACEQAAGDLLAELGYPVGEGAR
ncbi:MAG: sulfotransferase [bacterium]